jgi:hypothetical protein
MAKKELFSLAIICAAVISILTCGDSSHKTPKAKRWMSDKATVGYNSEIDRLRGNFYGGGSSLTPRYMGRKKSIVALGDYLNWPQFSIPRAISSKLDSTSSEKIKYYLRNLLQNDYYSDGSLRFIKNYRDILGDTSRGEFFGRFTVDNQSFSLGGWYDKFAVIGVYTLFDNPDEFLKSAQKYLKLPTLFPDSLRDSSKDSLLFYEYIDHTNGFRLRGFPLSLRPQAYFGDGYVGTVIEFTKYDYTKYIHDFVRLNSEITAKADANNTFREWPTDLDYRSYPFIDSMRGMFSIPEDSLTPYNNRGRFDHRIPGDYLFVPALRGLYYQESALDSITQIELRGYLKDMMNGKFYSDTLTNFIADFKSVLKDSGRNEFYGQFINSNMKMSFAGWYDKFAVIGLYVPFHDEKSFLAIARKYLNIPDIDSGKIEVTQRDDRSYYEQYYENRDKSFRIFYEIYDRKMAIRLRGFDIFLIDNDYLDNEWHTTVIEFTKYYDPEFEPWEK